MRLIVYGAGAVGGSLGGLLARAGYQVVLIARGAHLAALRAEGLRLETGAGTESLAIPSVASPAEIDFAPGDVVLLTMKSQDTEPALEQLIAAASLDGFNPDGSGIDRLGGGGLASELPIVSVQNGVVNEPLALRRFAKVYGVCVMFPASHTQPGVVSADCAPVPGILDIGAYPSGIDETAEAVAAAFRAAGCHSEPRNDIMAWKYTKLLMNLANGLQAVCGGDGIADLVERARHEGRDVLRSAGIPFIEDDVERARRGDILQTRPGLRRGGGSTWQSLHRGVGAVETDYLSGEVVLLGRTHGVATPVNALVQEVAARFARERRPAGSMPVAEFRTLLAERGD